MDPITKSEGFYYSIDHLVEAGCVPNHDITGVLAFHSIEDWDHVSAKLKNVWGYSFSWTGPTLLKQSPMRDGRTNYVFRIDPV